MEWSKVKNMILLMLVMTNLLLLVFVAMPQAQSGLSVDAGRQSALSILSSRGIEVDSQIVPLTITHTAQTIVPDRTIEESLATNLLGTVSMLDLGGDVFQYVGDSGSIRFHSGGEFSAQLTENAFPLGNQSALVSGATLAKALNLTLQLVSLEEEDGASTLTYYQLWDDVLLLDYGLTLHYTEGYLSEISDAKRLYGTTTLSSDESISVATALMQFAAGIQSLGDICQSITAITAAYNATTDLSGAVQLTPLWCIETDTGSYQLDLVTGTLTRG